MSAISKVRPTNSSSPIGDVKNWGADEGKSKVTKQKKAKSTRRRSMIRRQDSVHHNSLESADIEVIKSRPHFSDEDTRTHISMHLVIKKIRKIDFVNSNVDLRFIIALQWEHPKLKGYICDASQLWTPNLDILNADNLTQKSDIPWFYPDHGLVRQNIIFEGSIGNENDFSNFPFDMDCFRIVAVVELDTGDDLVKLTYNRSKRIGDIVPSYNDRQVTEFKLHTDLTIVRRVKLQEYNDQEECMEASSSRQKQFHLMGKFNTVEVTINLSRHYGFYLWKIMLILTMVCFLSWIVFFLDEFQARVEIGLTLFLSAIAFLYIVSDSLPKLGFLTTMDIMVLGCFFNIFLTIVETFVVFKVIKDDETREVVDGISRFCFPIIFLLCIYGVMFKSLYNKWLVYDKLAHGGGVGISKDLYE